MMDFKRVSVQSTRMRKATLWRLDVSIITCNVNNDLHSLISCVLDGLLIRGFIPLSLLTRSVALLFLLPS